jgi:hypothetical protein
LDIPIEGPMKSEPGQQAAALLDAVRKA